MDFFFEGLCIESHYKAAWYVIGAAYLMTHSGGVAQEILGILRNGSSLDIENAYDVP